MTTPEDSTMTETTADEGFQFVADQMAVDHVNRQWTATFSHLTDAAGLEPAGDSAAIATDAIALLLSVGCYGLDAGKQRQLWQQGLDLYHRLHPDEPRYVVWTPEEGDIDPARKEGPRP